MRSIFINSGMIMINHTIGSAAMTPGYPNMGTSVAAITIFPIIYRELEISGTIRSPSPCMEFLTIQITAVT